MADKGKYKRLTSLGVRGEELRIDDQPLLWLQKLNSFEMEDARAEGQVARSRTMMVFGDPESPGMVVLRRQVERMGTEDLVSGVVASQYTRHVGEVTNALSADPEWADRLAIIDRTDVDAVPDEERELVGRLNREYLAEVTDRVTKLQMADREELTKLDREELAHRYIDAYVESRGSAAFMRELRLYEVLYGVRMCDAEGEVGPWDHSRCAHDRLYTEVAEVRALPDSLFDTYATVFDRMNVPVSSAKDSASRQASSEPSRPQSEQGESAPSTPEEASGERPGTSV